MKSRPGARSIAPLEDRSPLKHEVHSGLHLPMAASLTPHPAFGHPLPVRRGEGRVRGWAGFLSSASCVAGTMQTNQAPIWRADRRSTGIHLVSEVSVATPNGSAHWRSTGSLAERCSALLAYSDSNPTTP